MAGAAATGLSKKGGGNPFRAFRSANYTFFWFASLLSITSFFMLLIARGWLVFDLTSSALMVTVVAAASQVPSLVLSVFGGVLADRFNRKTILLVAETANFFTLLTLAMLVFTETIAVWHLVVLALINGINFALAFPARAAIVPSLVAREDIANGVALSSIMFSGAQLIGPPVAGALLLFPDKSLAFFVAAGAVAAALPLFYLLKLHPAAWEHAGRPSTSVLTNIKEGADYIRRDKVVLGLMAMGLVAVVFGMPYQTVLPVFAEAVLDAGQLGLGLLAAAGGLGAIIGSVVVAAFSGQNQLKAFMAAGVLGLGMFIMAFSLSTIFVLSLALAFFAGFFFQLMMTGNFALLQVIVPDQLRGRVLSVRFIVFGLSPIGVLSLGVAAERVGTPVATAGTGLACLVGGALVLYLFAGLRKAAGREEEAQGRAMQVGAGTMAEPPHSGAAGGS